MAISKAAIFVLIILTGTVLPLTLKAEEAAKKEEPQKCMPVSYQALSIAFSTTGETIEQAMKKRDEKYAEMMGIFKAGGLDKAPDSSNYALNRTEDSRTQDTYYYEVSANYAFEFESTPPTDKIFAIFPTLSEKYSANFGASESHCK